ncbi:MAG TPA: NAD(P)H-binding protein [Paludibacter sp.]|nr:NAD(P)H-binding protein [Paludibacter sp.]
MSIQKAIVLGATGTVGKELIEKLIENKNFTEIISLDLKPSGLRNPKLTEHIVDFDKPETWKNVVQGDVLFSTWGSTTVEQAKTKDEQYEADFTYQYNVAQIAALNGVTAYVLVSAAGANVNSNALFLKMKGKLDKAVQRLPFEYINILRPGKLYGNITETVLSERIKLSMLRQLNKIGLLKQFRPIKEKIVAKAMIHAARKYHSTIYTLDEVYQLAK